MNEKMMSAIQKLVLTDATFNGETVEPTFINFFYGKNGAGKSTIARTIRGNLPRILRKGMPTGKSNGLTNPVGLGRWRWNLTAGDAE